MGHSVGQAAGFAGVAVRALHHYDGIGPLSPGGRGDAGHRRHHDADLDRPQQTLFHRAASGGGAARPRNARIRSC